VSLTVHMLEQLTVIRGTLWEGICECCRWNKACCKICEASILSILFIRILFDALNYVDFPRHHTFLTKLHKWFWTRANHVSFWIMISWLFFCCCFYCNSIFCLCYSGYSSTPCSLVHKRNLLSSNHWRVI